MRHLSLTLCCVTAFVTLGLPTTGCCSGPHPQSMQVAASAYTMREAETKKGNVGLTAWGDHLKPGKKAVAVSRDLVADGLVHGARIQIEGLKGDY